MDQSAEGGWDLDDDVIGFDEADAPWARSGPLPPHNNDDDDDGPSLPTAGGTAACVAVGQDVHGMLQLEDKIHFETLTCPRHSLRHLP